jgi:hypothetical protein
VISFIFIIIEIGRLRVQIEFHISLGLFKNCLSQNYQTEVIGRFNKNLCDLDACKINENVDAVVLYLMRINFEIVISDSSADEFTVKVIVSRVDVANTRVGVGVAVCAGTERTV